jgi:MoaA/NifB/PqqE/SkfB family radical SAM enzyme
MNQIRIKHLLFEVTNKCNFNCKYCYFFNSNKIPDELDTDSVFRIIKHYKKNYQGLSIGFTGGEPFMREDIEEIFEYSKSLGLKVAVGSNGSLINDYISAIRKNIDSITINYDGYEKYFNYVTGTNKHKTVEKNIELLSDKNINFGIHTNITPKNINNFNSILDFVLSVDAKFWQIGFIYPSFDSEKSHDKYLLDQKELEEIINKIKKVKNVRIDYSLLDASNFPRKGKRIFAPFFVIRPDGSFYPMVDVSNRWVLANDFLNDINQEKLIKFIKVLQKCFTQAENKINNKLVVEPYRLIRKNV